MDGYQLPEVAVLNGKAYGFRWDFRVILKILRYLDDREKPEWFRWQVAVRAFFTEPVPSDALQAAMAYLARFIAGGREPERPGPKLLDWELDAPAILAGVNRVAGVEVRSLPQLHWWTFLSYFHGMSEGQLSLLVGIREKLRKGEKLTPPEQEFYRCNRAWVRMERPDPEKEKLLAMLR